MGRQEAAEGGGGDEDSTFPTLAALLGYVASRHSRLGQPAEPAEPLLMEARSMETLVEFARLCWQKQQPAGPASQELTAVLPELYQSLLEHALVRTGTSELFAAALHALLEAASHAPAAFAAAYCTRVPWLVGFLGHINPAARSTAGRLLGMAAASLKPAEKQALLEELVDKARNPEDTGGKAARFEDRDGAITALGFVLAQCAVSSTGSAPSLTLTLTLALTLERRQVMPWNRRGILTLTPTLGWDQIPFPSVLFLSLFQAIIIRGGSGCVRTYRRRRRRGGGGGGGALHGAERPHAAPGCGGCGGARVRRVACATAAARGGGDQHGTHREAEGGWRGAVGNGRRDGGGRCVAAAAAAVAQSCGGARGCHDAEQERPQGRECVCVCVCVALETWTLGRSSD